MDTLHVQWPYEYDSSLVENECDLYPQEWNFGACDLYWSAKLYICSCDTDSNELYNIKHIWFYWFCIWYYLATSVTCTDMPVAANIIWGVAPPFAAT